MRQTSGLLLTHEIEEAGILVGEAVVILPPDRGGDQQVERRDRRAPSAARLRRRQPLGVLVEHRVDDVDEGFVGGEESVSAGEKIAFEPAFERVLAEHLHHAAVGRQLAAVGVFGQIVRQPEFLARFVDGVEPVGRVLVGAEDAKVVHVLPHDIAQESPSGRVFSAAVLPGLFDLDGVVAEVGQAQRLAQQAAVGVRIGAHAPRRPLGQAPSAPAISLPLSSNSSSGL